VHCVFGNIDDRYLTTLKAAQYKINLYGEFAELGMEKRKIAVVHLPMFAQALAGSGKYDAVFYGHTHKAEKKRIGKSLLLNPGEIMGRLGKPSIAIYDTEKNDAEIVEI
jgi:uncharacterized protein